MEEKGLLLKKLAENIEPAIMPEWDSMLLKGKDFIRTQVLIPTPTGQKHEACESTLFTH